MVFCITSFSLYPPRTDEYRVTTLFKFLCLILLNVTVFLVSTRDEIGISFILPVPSSLKIIYWFNNVSMLYLSYLSSLMLIS